MFPFLRILIIFVKVIKDVQAEGQWTPNGTRESFAFIKRPPFDPMRVRTVAAQPPHVTWALDASTWTAPKSTRCHAESAV